MWKLIGFTVSGAISVLFPYFFVFSFTPSKAEKHRHSNVRDCRWSPDGDVQPLHRVPRRIVATTSIHATPYLFLPHFVFELHSSLHTDPLHVGSCTHSSKLFRKTVAHSVVYSCSPRVLLTRQLVVLFFILENTAFARPAVFNTEAQPPPDCSLPLAVQHPLFGRGFSPRGSQTLTADGHSSFSRVQSRPEVVCSVDLESCQGAADGDRKTESLRGIHKVHLKGPLIASAPSSCSLLCVPSHTSIPPCSLPSAGYSGFFVMSKDISSCEVAARMPKPPKFVRNCTLVKSSSRSDRSAGQFLTDVCRCLPPMFQPKASYFWGSRPSHQSPEPSLSTSTS